MFNQRDWSASCSCSCRRPGMKTGFLKGTAGFSCGCLVCCVAVGKTWLCAWQAFERKWKWKSISHVRLFVTPGYTVHGILQARILEWVAFPFSRGSSQPRDRTQVIYMQANLALIISSCLCDPWTTSACDSIFISWKLCCLILYTWLNSTQRSTFLWAAGALWSQDCASSATCASCFHSINLFPN